MTTDRPDAEDQGGPDEDAPANYPASDPIVPPVNDGGATQALSGLLTLSPFLDLHLRAGGDHPKRAGLCFALDLLLRLVAAVLLLGVIGGVAWKVLAPLPDLFGS